MTSLAHDFTGYQVLVVGGSRGTGHTIATAFTEAGADVIATGTMMLPELYATDLSGMDYETVNLARQDSIDQLVASLGHLDVLVLAAGANLPYALPESERSFITEAVRSGVLGPTFLTTRLRLKLGQSPALGGGSVIQTSAMRHWYDLANPGQDTARELVEATERTADNCAGIGVRINSILEVPRVPMPRQFAATRHLSTVGDTLVRTEPRTLARSVADSALFLASESAARITGQTLRVG